MHQLGTEISNSQSSADICSELVNFRRRGVASRDTKGQKCMTLRVIVSFIHSTGSKNLAFLSFFYAKAGLWGAVGSRPGLHTPSKPDFYPAGTLFGFKKTVCPPAPGG